MSYASLKKTFINFKKKCFCRSEVEEDSDLESNSSLCEEPLSIREERERNIKPKPSIPPRSRAPKRPDKPLYMPRAARERLSLRNSQGSTAGSESLSSACVDRSSVNSLSDSCTCPESIENTKHSLSKQESFPSVADRVPKLSADSSAMCPQEEEKLVLRLDEDEASVLEQTQSQFAELTVEEDEKEKDETASVSRSLQTEDASTDKDGVTAEVSSHRLNFMVWMYAYSLLVLLYLLPFGLICAFQKLKYNGNITYMCFLF